MAWNYTFRAITTGTCAVIEHLLITLQLRTMGTESHLTSVTTDYFIYCVPGTMITDLLLLRHLWSAFCMPGTAIAFSFIRFIECLMCLSQTP